MNCISGMIIQIFLSMEKFSLTSCYHSEFFSILIKPLHFHEIGCRRVYFVSVWGIARENLPNVLMPLLPKFLVSCSITISSIFSLNLQFFFFFLACGEREICSSRKNEESNPCSIFQYSFGFSRLCLLNFYSNLI